MLSSVLYTYIVVFYKWLSRRWAWRSPPQSRAGLEFFFSLSLQPLHSFFFPPSSLLFISPLHLFSSSFSSCHFFNTDQSFVCGLVSVLPTCYWWIFSLVFFFYLFSLLEVVTRSLNLYYFFPLSRLCSNFHRHNGFGI